MKNIFSLNQKKILVTGSSSGIGRAIAIQCAAQGGSISLVARNESKLIETKELLVEGEHTFFIADLANDEAIFKLASELPILDGIVLNAGLVKTVPVRFIKREVMDDMFNLNIQGSILLIQQLVKLKKIKNGASICFISSIASQKVTLGNAIYSATKGAVNAFTKALALELSSKKIRVNAILPGFVETNILNESAISDEQLEIHKNNYPIGRFGQPDDIAYLAVYLMSDASQWMTGSLLPIDGGYSL